MIRKSMVILYDRQERGRGVKLKDGELGIKELKLVKGTGV